MICGPGDSFDWASTTIVICSISDAEEDEDSTCSVAIDSCDCSYDDVHEVTIKIRSSLTCPRFFRVWWRVKKVDHLLIIRTNMLVVVAADEVAVLDLKNRKTVRGI